MTATAACGCNQAAGRPSSRRPGRWGRSERNRLLIELDLPMKCPQSTEIPLHASDHGWQYSLRDIFLVTLAASVVLGTGKAFGGLLGPIELGLVILAGVSVLAAGILTRIHWPWILGLVLLSLAAWLLTPSGFPLRYRLLAAGLVSGVYATAGLPVILVSRPGEKRWPWMLGAVACFLAPALVTAADPLSMLIAAAPLWLCYTLVTLAWSKRRSALLVMGPVFFLGGVGIVLGSYYYSDRAAHSSAATPAFNPLPPVAIDLLMSASALIAQLGGAVTILAMLTRSRPEAERDQQRCDAS